MRRFLPFIALILISVSTFAQVPESFSYQAVLRDAGGQELPAQTVGMQISILQSSAIGTAVYVEQFTTATNDYGLVTLDIGKGTPQSGDFANIDWSSGPYFIKVELDPAGSTNYTLIGTSQLLSVPYALHAQTSDQLSLGETWLKNGSKLYFLEDNVGIGTNDPIKKLHVQGTVPYSGMSFISDENDRPTILLSGGFPNFIIGSNGNDNHGATLGFWNFDNDATTYQWNLGGGRDGNFSIGFARNSNNPHCGINGFTNNCTDALTPLLINPDGMIGINQTNPQFELDVVGDANIDGDLLVQGNIEDVQYYEIHSSGGPNLEGSGIRTYVTVDANAVGITSALYIASDGNYEEANAAAEATMPCVALALEEGTGEKDILLHGFIRNDAWSFTPGAPVYVSPTAGELTQVIPATTGQQVQVVGIATATNILYFNPDLTVIELN